MNEENNRRSYNCEYCIHHDKRECILFYDSIYNAKFGCITGMFHCSDNGVTCHCRDYEKIESYKVSK